MKKVFRLFTALTTALIVMAACNSNKAKASEGTSAADSTTAAKEEVSQDSAKKDSNILIVYFSHAGENYSVGNVKVGNTKLVADEVQKLTGGDMFEVVSEESYDMPYDQLTDLAKKEAEEKTFPEFKGEIKDIAKYDTIFIGSPIWWGTYPRVMFTFFKKYDLNGKTLIPFTTHEGSGLGSTVEDLKNQYPNATVTDAFSIAGHDVRSGMDKVDEWIEGLRE